MKFCVLIKIRKNVVTFWYQIKGSNFSSLKIKESNEAPLFFYVNGNDFIFGNYAKERFYCNDPFAYGDYFRLITDPSKHFNIYGIKKPVKQLLYIAIEQYLDFFIKNVLYKSESIESYRQNFPLRFIFDSDIEDKEKLLVESLFKEAGYDNVQRESYYEALFNSLLQDSVIKSNTPVLLLSGIDNVLYLELFKNQFVYPDAITKIEGQGSDPRVRILSDVILEDILARNSYLQVNRDKEIASLVSLSANLLRESTPIMSGEANLSDGSAYYFKVKTRELNDRLLYYSDDNKIFNQIDELFKDNSLRSNSVSILLNGSEINTDYFSEKLLKNYPNVIGIPSSSESIALKSIFKKNEEEDYQTKRKHVGPPQVPPIGGKVNQVDNKNEYPLPPAPPPLPPTHSIEQKKTGLKTPVPPPPPPIQKKGTPATPYSPPPPPPPSVHKKADNTTPITPPPPPKPNMPAKSDKKQNSDSVKPSKPQKKNK